MPANCSKLGPGTDSRAYVARGNAELLKLGAGLGPAHLQALAAAVLEHVHPDHVRAGLELELEYSFVCCNRQSIWDSQPWQRAGSGKPLFLLFGLETFRPTATCSIRQFPHLLRYLGSTIRRNSIKYVPKGIVEAIRFILTEYEPVASHGDPNCKHV